MYQRIIIGLDGSETAEKALPYAVSLAEKYGGMLTLVTVAHPLSELSTVQPSLATQAAISQDVVARTESAREKAADRQYLDDLTARIASRGVDVETRLREAGRRSRSSSWRPSCMPT
jgi:nucleotide-binding universal stress UspA family protein